MKIAVLGDVCTDVFVYGVVPKLCGEAPVPVFNPISVVSNKGMAGNVEENLKSLGAEVDLFCNHETIIKKRIVEQKSNQLIVRIDENDKVSNSFDVNKIDFSKYDACVISDYDKGYLSIGNLLEISRHHNNTFLDTKKILSTWYMDKFKFIKINEPEWETSKRNGNNESQWFKKLIVTKGDKGCTYMGEDYLPKEKAEVRDVSGAGDTFLAALVVKYVQTEDIKQAIEFANECAGKVITKKGVSVI